MTTSHYYFAVPEDYLKRWVQLESKIEDVDKRIGLVDSHKKIGRVLERISKLEKMKNELTEKINSLQQKNKGLELQIEVLNASILDIKAKQMDYEYEKPPK
jgi:peptidoglycan hydrolase CwlO-like protein